MQVSTPTPPPHWDDWPKGTTDSGDVVVPTFLVIHYSSNFIETVQTKSGYFHVTRWRPISLYVFFSDVQSHILTLSSRSMLICKSVFQRKG